MLIDWFTVVAQILNFLLLVVLLKHFLYGPILEAMDTRQQGIAQQLEKATAAEREAEREAEVYREKSLRVDIDRQALLAQAKIEAEEQRKVLITQARNEVDTLQTGWREALRREQRTFLDNLRQRVAEEVHRIAHRALQDLASASLEKQVIDTFITRLQSLDPQQREGIMNSVQNTDTGALIFTAFPLPDTTQKELTTVVQECLASQSKYAEYARHPQQSQQQCSVRFECAPDLVCGIELKTPGHKIGWSIGHYLQMLEDGVLTALEEESRERDEHTNRTTDRLG